MAQSHPPADLAACVLGDPAPDGELLSGGAPCYRIYRTADDQYLSVGSLEPKFWQALVVALGLRRSPDRSLT